MNPSCALFSIFYLTRTAHSQMVNNPGNIWGRFYATLGREYVVPGTWEQRKSYLAMTEQGTRMTVGGRLRGDSGREGGREGGRAAAAASEKQPS